MPHWRAGHESISSYLRSSDLYDERKSEQAGRPVYFSPVVEIEKMTVERLRNKDKAKGEQRNVAHFRNHRKGLGLNVTNAETLTSLAGSPDTNRWVGLRIQLYVDQGARYPNGTTGPAIRISPQPPKGGVDKPPPELTHETRDRLDREHEERLDAPAKGDVQ